VALAARLTSGDGSPLGDRTITFEIAGQTLTATTNETGLAEVTATVPDHGRSQIVVVRFSGDADHLPSETSARITWGGSKNAAA
jgi:hypothetical protein